MSTFTLNSSVRTFYVIPDSGFFPNPEPSTGDDPGNYSCDVVFTDATSYYGLKDAVSIGSARRNVGTRTFDYTASDGRNGVGSLVVPNYSGQAKTYTQAILRSMGSPKGNARVPGQWRASLSFWILSDITP